MSNREEPSSSLENETGHLSSAGLPQLPADKASDQSAYAAGTTDSLLAAQDSKHEEEPTGNGARISADKVVKSDRSLEELPAWLRDESPTPAIKWILLVNSFLYAAMLFASLLDMAANAPSANPLKLAVFTADTLLNFGANSAPATIIDHQYWRLLSNTFVHASVLHLAMNMYVLWDFTKLVERIYGSSKFLTIYLCAALGSSICSLLFINPDGVSAGASGAIFGAFGALVTYFWAFRKEIPKMFFRMYAKMFFVFAIYTVVSASVFPGMDNAAHLGGFLSGLWTGLCLLPQSAGGHSWRERNFVQLACVFVLLGVGVVLDVRMNANNPQVIGHALFQQAKQLLRQERLEAGIQKLDAAAKMLPAEASIYANAASAYEKLPAYDKACTLATRALKLDPKSEMALRARAAALHNMGKEAESINDYTHLLQLDHFSSPIVFNNRAWCYDACGMPEKALADTNKALAINPRCASAYDTRGMAYVLLKNYQLAKKDFDVYIALKADDGAAYYHRALVLHMLGNVAEANADLAQARSKKYKLDPWERAVLAPVLDEKSQ
jgi:membrane associated rhomboid family serine protease/regulator of sirC expression with transglutaminase-like and TPR domain